MADDITEKAYAPRQSDKCTATGPLKGTDGGAFHGPSYEQGVKDGIRRSFDPIEDIFTYHAPNIEQSVKYENIREGAKFFAKILVKNMPYCSDQRAAIRKLREAVMTANAAIALEGREL